MPNFGTGRLLGPPVGALPPWMQGQAGTGLARAMMMRRAPVYNPANQQVGGGSIDMSHTIPAYTGPYGNGVSPVSPQVGGILHPGTPPPGAPSMAPLLQSLGGASGSVVPGVAGGQIAASTPYNPQPMPGATAPILARAAQAISGPQIPRGKM